MATRATISIARREEGVSFSVVPKQTIVDIYSHWDGYPEGLGVKLASYLDGYHIVNGLGREGDNDKPVFTRDGSFQLDRDGNVVNTDGLPLLGEGQTPINIPFTKPTEEGAALLSEISVKSDGSILVTYGLDDIEVVGQLELADFTNEGGLQNIGNARFEETGESGEPTFNRPKEGPIGKIEPGFLEKSNTDITDEIVLMLRTQQAFNGCSKMLQSDVEITKKLYAR